VSSRLDVSLSDLVCGCFLSAALLVAAVSSAIAQDSRQAANAQTPSLAVSAQADQNNKPSVTFKAVTHHVVVDVVAKDKQGHPVRDLTAKDFQVSERVGWAGKVPETIAAFRLVDKTQPHAAPPSIQELVRTPAGSYSNIAAVREPDDPLTLLLLDDLNSDLFARDTRRDLLKMVDSVNFNVPVSVLFLGNTLNVLQDFDSDPKQLRSTVHKLMNIGPFGPLHFTTAQAPSAGTQKQLSQQLKFTPLGISPAMQQQLGVVSSPSSLPFEEDTARLTDDRVFMTLDALRAIARHLAGYPGRKKLVWVSDSFPFSVLPDPSDQSDSAQSYRDQVQEIVNALSEARVAVYPIRPGGVWLPDLYSASRKDRPPTPQGAGGRPLGPQFAMGQAMSQQSAAYYAARATAEQIGQQTGGESCLSSNDLGWCLKEALSDGYTYYELAYYPSSESWKEGLHHITVKTTRAGVLLSYRQDYYVEADEFSKPSRRKIRTPDAILRQAACEDLLPATGLPLTVTPLSRHSKDEARYLLKVEALVGQDAVNSDEHGSRLQLSFAACTFDRAGRPLQYGLFPVNEELNEQTYKVLKQRGFQRVFGFDLNAHVSRIRWVAQNSQTGVLGSIDLPNDPDAPSSLPDNAADNNNQASPVVESQGVTLPLPAEPSITSQPQAQPAANDASASGNIPKLQTDSEIASYCAGLGQPGPHAEALAKVCEFTLSLGSKLPNLLCQRKTSRHWRVNNYAAHDEVATEVAYRDGIEYDSDVPAAGRANRINIYRRRDSSTSGGEFAPLLQAVFNPVSFADFDFQGEETINSVPALVFAFRIEQNNNRHYYLHATQLSGGEATFFPAYRGRLWLAKSTFYLLRVERGTVDVPSSFPISYASTIVDYSNVALGDGTYFVLPVGADIEVCSPDEGKECAHNIVHYTNYHKFRATTKLVFNQDSK